MAAQPKRVYSELSSGRRGASRNYLVLLVILCFSVIACGGPPPGPDYAKPATEGEKPPKDVMPSYSITTNTPLPSPLVCDQAYKITAKVLESGVKCEGYTFTKLFNLASSLVANQVKSLSPTCPKDCSPLQQLNSAMRWKCQEGLASLTLQVSLICPKPGAKLPENHQPSAEELAKNDFLFNPAGDELDRETDMDIVQVLYASQPCPGKELFKVYYKEVVPNFATLINSTDCSSAKKQPFYRTYVSQATTLATAYYNAFTCTAPCTKAPFKVFRQEWGCDTNDKAVWVATWFYVECKK